MLSTTEEELRDYFVKISGGDDQEIERVKKISDYAFVHFKDREVAAMCLSNLNGEPLTYILTPNLNSCFLCEMNLHLK